MRCTGMESCRVSFGLMASPSRGLNEAHFFVGQSQKRYIIVPNKSGLQAEDNVYK